MPTPPLGGRNFEQNQGGRLHHEVAHLLYITTLAIVIYFSAYYWQQSYRLVDYSVDVYTYKVFIIYEQIIVSVSTSPILFGKTGFHIAFEIIAVILFCDFNP